MATFSEKFSQKVAAYKTALTSGTKDEQEAAFIELTIAAETFEEAREVYVLAPQEFKDGAQEKFKSMTTKS